MERVPPFSSYGQDGASGASPSPIRDESSEWSESSYGETYLAHSPNGSKAASGSRAKADKDGVNARR